MNNRPISRKRLLQLALVGLLAHATGDAFADRPTDAPPNVVLILADDIGTEILPMYGNTTTQAPHLSRMAQNGMVFEKCFSQPICTPSRVQLMTGRYGHRNYEGFGRLPTSEVTFATLLQDVGYHTAIAGKWQLSGKSKKDYSLSAVEHVAQAGFDEHCLWQLSFGRKRGERYSNPTIERNGSVLEGLEDRYGPDVFSDFVLDFIERKQDVPFFVYYPMALPHVPHWPTPDSDEWADQDTRRPGDAYLGGDVKYFHDMVQYMDKVVGRVIAQLERLKLSENTVVMFAGDNGTVHLIETTLNGRTIVGGKGKTTDAGTHVPLIVSWPGTITAGSRNTNLVDFSDFLPTLVELASAQLPQDRDIDGISFLKQLTGEEAQPRTWSYCYYWKGGRNRRKVLEFVRDTRWKRYLDGRFYDLDNDPEELHSIEYQQRTAEAKRANKMFKQAFTNLGRTDGGQKKRQKSSKTKKAARAGS